MEHMYIDFKFKKPKVFIGPKEVTWDMVEKEALLIRDNFTEEEINNLNFDDFNGENEYCCIYGLMLGSCNHIRVAEFIDNNLKYLVGKIDKEGNLQEVNKFDVDHRTYTAFMTPLEEYIYPRDNDFIDEDTSSDEYNEKIKQIFDLIKYGKR